MALTKDIIWKAADELDAEGIKPTLAAVRKRLGGVGSFTTIQDAMSEWKTHKQLAAQLYVEPPPQAVLELVSTLASEVWTVARLTADQALEGSRQKMAEETAQLREETAEAIALADSMDEELTRLRALVAELDQLKSEHLELQARNDMLKERSALELQHAHDKVEAATKERHSAQERATQAEIRAAKADGRVEALEGQISRLMAEQKTDKGSKAK